VAKYPTTLDKRRPARIGRARQTPGRSLDPESRRHQSIGLAAVDGEAANLMAQHLAYWFGWYSFFPQTDVWEPAP
jgi:hypothetical protein